MPSFLSALLFILPAIVSAQEPIQRDDAAVEKVASEGFRAVQASKWNKFVELMHPDALREVKGLIAPALEAAAKDDSEEVEQVLRLFSGIKDVKQLLEMPADKLFVSLIKGVTANVPGFKQALSNSEFQIIGTV